MDRLNFVLSALSILILAIGLVYTYRLGTRQHNMRGEYDTEINEKVQDHPYIRNPVFLTYAVASALVIAFIIYTALSSSW
ncbi:hypothetical protein PY093_01490 [Cytobacillus sp. S13-E01]|uniref:hypothetical protein n=1 Tax=Cytobacillus sp. S13-E01 TaxID=3031326 RepID=UPI0023D88249|nr:hypothetical protein [Cytobacillus sp. S13-E01]MDF0725381.1 hypothetical protein [Cytobacillus sp. S13-E01]